MTQTKTFAYTGAAQPFPVPAGVTSVVIDAKGAAGGGTWIVSPGGRAQGTLAVTPGETLWVYVPGKGGSPNGSAAGAAGWNGGAAGGAGNGSGGGGGGGGADVRQGGQALSNRKIVAAGAGGQAKQTNGGSGGGTTGGTGGSVPSGAWGGHGGTPSAGGAVAGTTGGPVAGSLGAGGHGAANTSGINNGGGGGGGGYYGGAGGALAVGGGAWGGGGGGSSYLGGVTASSTTLGGGSTGNGTVTLTFNVPPNAPTLTSPATGTAVDASVAPTVTWSFSDPDPGDSQSSADVQYRAVGDSFTTVPGAVDGPAGAWTFPTVLVADTVYEWQVRTYDQAGAVSPWSASSFFTPRTPSAAPVIVTPPAGSAVTTDPVTYQWTPSGTQSGYQLVLCADVAGTADLSTIYLDQTVPGASTSTSVALQANGVAQATTFHVRVRTYTYAGVWSPWTDWGVQLLNLSPPGVPTLHLIPDIGDASIHVQITNPTGPNPTVSVDLYRTDLTEGSTELRIQAALAPNTTVTDWTPAAGHEYRYRAVGTSPSGGIASSN